MLFVKTWASKSEGRLRNSSFAVLAFKRKSMKMKGKGLFNYSFFPNWEKILYLFFTLSISSSFHWLALSFHIHIFFPRIIFGPQVTSKVIYFARSSCLSYVAWEIAFILFSWLRWKFEKEILFDSLCQRVCLMGWSAKSKTVCISNTTVILNFLKGAEFFHPVMMLIIPWWAWFWQSLSLNIQNVCQVLIYLQHSGIVLIRIYLKRSRDLKSSSSRKHQELYL